LQNSKGKKIIGNSGLLKIDLKNIWKFAMTQYVLRKEKCYFKYEADKFYHFDSAAVISVKDMI